MDFGRELKISLLEERVPIALELLDDCTVCPRNCHVNRTAGKFGVCGIDSTVLISSANLHHGEEPPISGERGSGTIFLAGCNLKCVYCQNYPISQFRNGQPASISQLADYMTRLEIRGAHNINIVTPSHCIPQIMAALLEAYKNGLRLPIVYNSSGYDKVSSLCLLDGIIDIYMPDMRYSSGEIAECYSSAEDYPEINKLAIREMHRQVGLLKLNGQGIALNGLLVRHLILPGSISGSEQIFKFIADEISQETYVSLMSQYFPAHKALNINKINRRIIKGEYREALKAFNKAGLINGFLQPFVNK